MYKVFLCLRYLRTRYIALASIISVTLGVATMIVVNSVMAGFRHEMQTRIHGVLSDVIIASRGLDGVPVDEARLDRIRNIVGDDLKGVSATVHVPAMLSLQIGGKVIPKQVKLIGIDQETYSQITDCGQFLQHPENRKKLSFLLHEDGYDSDDAQKGDAPIKRIGMKDAGWKWRRRWARSMQQQRSFHEGPTKQKSENDADETAPKATEIADQNPFKDREMSAPKNIEKGRVFNPLNEQHTGIILGIQIASFRVPGPTGEMEERYLVRPGDDVKITFPSAGDRLEMPSSHFTIVDFYESKMSEYDSSFVFVPLDKLQDLRGMIDPATGTRYATHIQIRLKDGVDEGIVRDRLRDAVDEEGRAILPPAYYHIATWRDEQGPLLAAVEMETAVLNILLFMIIAVAGFGILATFYMIVVEKTKDIGILKSLGASGRGVMGIFVSYGFTLGAVGGCAGLGLGLLLVANINTIRQWLEQLSGKPVFDPSIYYFQQIPTIVNPLTVAWIVGGAVVIAMVASVLPAIRAALLRPVEALRYE